MSAHTPQTELKLVGKLILEGEMTCETGLHVGAGKGSLEIGGRLLRDSPRKQGNSTAVSLTGMSKSGWSRPP